MDSVGEKKSDSSCLEHEDDVAGATRRGRLRAALRSARRPVLWISLVSGALTLAGCDAEYAYVPTTNPTAVLSGHVAANYGIPPEAPCGDLRVASSGFTRLPVESEADDGRMGIDRPLSLHLRLMARNGSNDPWVIDSRSQRVDFEGYGAVAPTFVSADHFGSPPPLVVVSPGARRSLDLYFAVPEELQDWDEESIPPFAAVWSLSAGAQSVREKTTFERLRVNSADDYAELDFHRAYAWGGTSWRNPLGRSCDNPYSSR